jgi:hypothetical protein
MTGHDDETQEVAYGEPRTLPAVRDETVPLVPLPEPTEQQREAAKEHLAMLYDELAELSAHDIPRVIPGDPGCSQSEWDRRQVRQLRRTEEAGTYLEENTHLGDAEAVRRARIILDRGLEGLEEHLAACDPGAVAAYLAAPMLTITAADSGTIYTELLTGTPPKAAAPGRRRKRTPKVVPGDVITSKDAS